MATWLAEFLDKLGTWSNQAWASLEPIMPNVAKIPKDFLEATQQTLYMTFWTALWSGIFGILLGVVLVVTHDGGILENRWFYRILDQLVNIFRSIPFIILVALLATTTRFLAGTTIGSKAAILGIGAIEKELAILETASGDVVATRHKMYLSFSYDHRIIDGMLGGAFLQAVAHYLEDWKTNKGL